MSFETTVSPGVIAPATLLLRVGRYPHESPATKEHLATVDGGGPPPWCKQAEGAFAREITMEHALNAATVVTPIRLYAGARQRDGAAALVIAVEDVLEGPLPVNPSSRLKSQDRPRRATGVAQCVELFAQLGGEAIDQADRARIAMAHNIGGPTAVAAVTIVEGPEGNGG